MLQAGDVIPDFTLASDTAGDVKAADLRGKRFVLYFYPNDDTPGCTVEACNFRDNLPDFGALGVPIYGISPNSIESHGKFRAKFELTFPLLADTDHAVAEKFGTWVEKNNYGKKYMGIQRSTFVIGADGRVERVWEKVTPAEHAQEVLEYLKSSPSPVAAPPTRKVAAKKLAVKKAAAKKVAVKEPAVKKAAAKKPVPKKVAVKKSAAKKAVVKKPAAKKVAVKKSTR